MAMIQIPQTTFSAGEISPTLGVRSDVQSYNSSLKKARNALLHPQGGISNRCGFIHIAAANKAGNVVIQEFVFNDAAVYLLEFGDKYIRFYKNDIKDGADLVTPYLDEHIKELKFLQSADVVYIFHQSYPPKELRRYDGSWDLVDFEFINGPFRTMNDNPSKKMFLSSNGATTNGWTLKFKNSDYPDTSTDSEALFFKANMVGSLFRVSKNFAADGFEKDIGSNWKSKIMLGGSGSGWRFRSAGTWAGKVFLEICDDLAAKESEWETLHLFNSNNNQNFDSSGAFHKLCWVRIRSVNLIGSCITSFDIDGFSFDAIFEVGHYTDGKNVEGELLNEINGLETFFPSSHIVPAMTSMTAPEGTVTPDTETTRGNIWKFFSGDVSNGANLKDNIPGDRWIRYDFVEGRRPTANALEVYSSGSSTIGTTLHIHIDHKNGTKQFNNLACSNVKSGSPFIKKFSEIDSSITKLENISSIRIGIVSAISAVRYAIVNIVDQIPDEVWTDDWSEGSWSKENGFPSCGCFYQDRLCLAGSKADPQTVNISKVGFYNDFGMSIPLVTSDAISVNLPSRKINQITNIASLNDIIVFTTDAEFSVGAGGSPLTPLSVQSKAQNYRGASTAPYAIIGNRILFVQNKGGYLRDIAYSFSEDGYGGEDLRVRAAHFFEGHKIVDLVYQQAPDSIVWAVRDDGKLLSLTYLREQQMLGWTMQETYGTIENICLLPTGRDEVLYAVIKRGSKKYIEKLQTRTFETAERVYDKQTIVNEDGEAEIIVKTFKSLANDCFLDSAGLYESVEPLDTISGLSRFKNTDVKINIDGNVYSGHVDDDDVLSLPVSGYRIIVGLPYIFEIETLNLSNPQANISALKGRIPFAHVDFYLSRGGIIGTDRNNLLPFIQRTDEMMGEPIALQTDKQRITLESNNQIIKTVIIVQNEALPMTVLAISPFVFVGEA